MFLKHGSSIFIIPFFILALYSKKKFDAKVQFSVRRNLFSSTIIPSSFAHKHTNTQMGTYEVMFYNAILVVIPATALAGVTGDLQKVFQACRCMLLYTLLIALQLLVFLTFIIFSSSSSSLLQFLFFIMLSSIPFNNSLLGSDKLLR